MIVADSNAGGTGVAVPGQGERIVELDGLRGIAVAFVMAQHAFTRPYLPFWEELFGQPAANVLDLLWCGVDIFFVLSGFLIGSIIFEHRGADRFYPAFYARRTARIFPAYFLLIAIASLRFGDYGPHLGKVPLLGYATFTSNLYTSTGSTFSYWLRPLWSVSIEEQFYLLAPLCLRLLPVRMIPWTLIAVIVGSAGLRSAATLEIIQLGVTVWDFTLTRLDGLALGVLAAWLLRKPDVVHAARQRLPALGRVFALLLLGCIGLAQLRDPIQVGPGILWLSVTAFVAIILVRLQPGSGLGRMLCWRYLVFLGRYSYFLYLFHGPALWLTAHLAPAYYEAPVGSRIAANILTLIALCAVASLSWRYFENPLLVLGRRVAYGRNRDQHEAQVKPAIAA